MLELPSDDDSDYSLPVIDEAPGQKATALHAFRTHAQLWGCFCRAWSVTIARGSDIGSTTNVWESSVDQASSVAKVKKTIVKKPAGKADIALHSCMHTHTQPHNNRQLPTD